MAVRHTAGRPRTRQRFVRLLMIALAVALAAVAFRGAVLRAAGWALVAEDAIAPVDAIVVPQSTGDAGALEAADLFHRGFGRRVAVFVSPNNPSTAELIHRGILDANDAVWLVRLLRRLNVGPIDQISGDNGGTQAEGGALPSWCARAHVHSIIVVTTRDHSRRVRRVLTRSMPGRTTVFVHSTPYDPFDPDRWWQTRDGQRTELVELEKLLVDIVRHPIS
jgi:hypothetical protein